MIISFQVTPTRKQTPISVYNRVETIKSNDYNLKINPNTFKLISR